MVNSHILSHPFEYLEPKTIEEALHYLVTYGEKARVIAGGTDLIVQMKMDKVHPAHLISIAKLPSLRYLIEEDGLRIGALTPFKEIEKSNIIKKQYIALYEAARSVSSVQIKNMGTIGGNLCNASPAADSAPPLIAFGAKVKIAKGNQERFLRLEEFFVGPGKTALNPKELLIEIEVPKLIGRTGSAFLKMMRVSADLAKISAAAVITREGDFCRDCKIVLGSVAEVPLRTKEAEKILIGKKFEEELVQRASLRASDEIKPIDDIRSTAWYRREVSRVLVRDTIKLAWKRAASH